MLPRRKMIELSASALLASGLWPGRLAAEENGLGDSNWTFLAINDLHYLTEECGAFFTEIVAAMKASAPAAEFCLLGGDQADDGASGHLGAVKDIFSKLNIPIYATPGNHDYLLENDRADRAAYDKVFAGHLNHSFEHRGWQIVGLDTTEGTHYHDTSIQAETFAWLRDHLPKLDRAKPTILYTHFPLGAEVKYRPKNADDLLGMFRDYNLQAVLNGHYHAYTERTAGAVTITTDRCCSRVRFNHDGSTQKGWFVCTAKEGKIQRRFVEIPEGLRNAEAVVEK